MHLDINFKIPKSVQYILDELEKFGYEAYIVGGSVRDSILKRKVHDWDITTSAMPEEVMKVFKDKQIIPTGLKHGTVTVLIDKEPFEITTYRIDGEYTDCRRPDSVSFTRNLIEDLKRRDFTINAMAYNPNVGLIDPFDGVYDIQHRILRCVGSPEKRFKEDALRILRLWRFSIQLGFYPTHDTENAGRIFKGKLKNISMERIQSEFVKALQGDKNVFCNQRIWYLESIIPEYADTTLFNQNNPYHIYSVGIHSLYAYEYLENSADLVTRIAALLHDIGKPSCYQDDKNGVRHFKGHAKVSANMADKILRRLKFDNNTREKVVELIYYHDATFDVGEKYVKRWLNKIGEEQFRRLLQLRRADIVAQNPEYVLNRLQKIYKIEDLLNEILLREECFSLKDLVINGDDVKTVMMIEEGKEIGYWLNEILNRVINGDLNNNRDDLIYWMTGITDGWIKL